MPFLEKLKFWKSDNVDPEYGIDGCFTLPDSADLDDDGGPAEAEASDDNPPQ